MNMYEYDFNILNTLSSHWLMCIKGASRVPSFIEGGLEQRREHAPPLSLYDTKQAGWHQCASPDRELLKHLGILHFTILPFGLARASRLCLHSPPHAFSMTQPPLYMLLKLQSQSWNELKALLPTFLTVM